MRRRPFSALSLALLASAVAAAPGFSDAARGEERLAGPIPAAVERVVDGDTIDVRARIWLGQEVRVLVRIRGIDAAETDGDCARERALAAAAALWLGQALADGRLLLTDVTRDKYGGRVLAEVWSGERNLGRGLLDAGLARPYIGGRRRDWCE